MLAIALERGGKPDADLATAVAEGAARRGLLLLKAGIYSNCIRVLVPLVIADAELDEALDVWEEALPSARLARLDCGSKTMAMHVGELIVGRYELEELVGEGGMSTVYRAYDTVLERRVAIKILHEHYSRDPEYVERFRREARAIARLAHPNVVTVIDRGEWEGRQFIVFEHVAGENLKAVSVREGPLPVDRALALACQIARALAFAHDLGIVHRDVKPHNVLLDGSGTAKVTDFGIARARLGRRAHRDRHRARHGPVHRPSRRTASAATSAPTSTHSVSSRTSCSRAGFRTPATR